jgi:hypothetical protein
MVVSVVLLAAAMDAAPFWLSMIFSDLPSPAEASSQDDGPCQGFAQAGNRLPTFRDHALEQQET